MLELLKILELLKMPDPFEPLKLLETFELLGLLGSFKLLGFSRLLGLLGLMGLLKFSELLEMFELPIRPFETDAPATDAAVETVPPPTGPVAFEKVRAPRTRVPRAEALTAAEANINEGLITLARGVAACLVGRPTGTS